MTHLCPYDMDITYLYGASDVANPIMNHRSYHQKWLAYTSKFAGFGIGFTTLHVEIPSKPWKSR